MGSTGQNLNAAKTAGSNIIQLPVRNNQRNTSMVDNENGWKYPEVTENVTRLEKSLNNARSVNKINAVAKALRQQDDRITAEIERLHNGTADVKGSEKALLTERRRVRQLMRKARI